MPIRRAVLVAIMASVAWGGCTDGPDAPQLQPGEPIDGMPPFLAEALEDCPPTGAVLLWHEPGAYQAASEAQWAFRWGPYPITDLAGLAGIGVLPTGLGWIDPSPAQDALRAAGLTPFLDDVHVHAAWGPDADGAAAAAVQLLMDTVGLPRADDADDVVSMLEADATERDLGPSGSEMVARATAPGTFDAARLARLLVDEGHAWNGSAPFFWHEPPHAVLTDGSWQVVVETPARNMTAQSGIEVHIGALDAVAVHWNAAPDPLTPSDVQAQVDEVQRLLGLPRGGRDVMTGLIDDCGFLVYDDRAEDG